jgi:hypothetical protein
MVAQSSLLEVYSCLGRSVDMLLWSNVKLTFVPLQLFDTIPGLRIMLNAGNLPEKTEDMVDEDYDPHKRDPQYAHASSSPIWELVRCTFCTLPTFNRV